MTGANGNGGERLDSWKAIANYLGRDEGTLRRWERTRGLPIRRVPGRKGGSVFAYKSEIDAWLLADPPDVGSRSDDAPTPAELPEPAGPTPASRSWIRIGVSAALVTLAVAGWWLIRPAASADELRIERSEATVTARNAGGQALWVHQLGGEFRHVVSQVAEYSRIVRGPRPRVYLATAARLRRTDNLVEGGQLIALDLNGARQWAFEFDDTVTIGGKPFGAPWGVEGFAIDDTGGSRRIAVAAHHYTWSASLVTVLDDEGRRQGTYVNDGWLEHLQWLAPNRLAVGGFRQSMNGGMVALIDPSALDAQSPESDPAHQCAGCGAGQPLRMAVMPRTELNLATGSRFNRVTLEHVGDRLLVRTVEVPAADQPPAEAIYEFTASLDLVRASFSERYWELHDQLRSAGRLDHDRAQCADRDGPRSIQMWSPEGGWVTRPAR